MSKIKPFQSEDWLCECPKCGEIIEMGDISRVQSLTHETCECGHKFELDTDEVI